MSSNLKELQKLVPSEDSYFEDDSDHHLSLAEFGRQQELRAGGGGNNSGTNEGGWFKSPKLIFVTFWNGLSSLKKRLVVILITFLLITGLIVAILFAKTITTGVVREYYIAAEEIDWDYTPEGKNLMTKQPFGPSEKRFVVSGPDRMGSKYRKAVFRQYINKDFITRTPVIPENVHLGLLGPIIRAEVGDTIIVHLKNKLRNLNCSIHAHGVLYSIFDEGNQDVGSQTKKKLKEEPSPQMNGHSNPNDIYGIVTPGETHTYKWQVPERAGPSTDDPTSIIWSYYSAVDEVADTNSGLIGPIVITKKGFANSDGTPRDIEREFVTLFATFDENKSHFLQYNIDANCENDSSLLYCSQDTPPQLDFVQSNWMHSINGFLYGNLPGLEMAIGQQTRWYLMTLGNRHDIHMPYWHGATVISEGKRKDVVELLPGSLRTVDMIPDNLGVWEFQCSVGEETEAGMQALYRVNGSSVI